jgi:hypothetical protein
MNKKFENPATSVKSANRLSGTPALNKTAKSKVRMDQRTFGPQEGTNDAEGGWYERPYFPMPGFCSLLIMFCDIKYSAGDDHIEDRHLKWTSPVGMKCEHVQMMECAGLTIFLVV